MDYTIKAVKASGQKDPHGNEWFSVLFESGDQASWLAKTEPRIGDTVYGNITEETKKSGEGTYKRFRKAQKDVTVTGSTSQTKFTEDPGKQDSIMRMNALTNAVNMSVGIHKAAVDENHSVSVNILAAANDFYEWLKNEKIEDKAKEVFPEAEEVKDEDFMDGEISLDDIPF